MKGSRLKQASLFLAEHLGELNVLDDPHEKVTTALSTISAVYDGMVAETVLMMLLAQVDIDSATKVAAVSYFRGSGLLNVQCDCHEHLCDISNTESDFWLRKGANDCEIAAPQFVTTKAWIDSLRQKLL